MRMLLCIILVMFSSLALGEDQNLTRAKPYLPVLREMLDKHWSTLSYPQVIAGQVEQESNWKEKAQLKTSRELGRGFAQLTIAYKQDGTERFNVYRDLIKYKELRNWDWKNDPFNPQNQLLYLILTDRNNFKRVSSMFLREDEGLAAAFVAYNAGLGTVLQRRALAIQGKKVSDRWFNGLENIRLPYESKKLYGRDLGEMRNEYPRNIFSKAKKYERYLNLD